MKEREHVPDPIKPTQAVTGASAHQDEANRAWGSLEQVMEVILFSDIQSSVQLQESIGTTRYAGLLRRHDELFGQAMDEAGGSGKIVKHTGDGFLAVFHRPSDAVMTGLRFQWLLRTENWPAHGKITARVGIHAGEVLMMPSGSDGPGMVGAAVNLAARVMGLAAGGQILVTRSVFDSTRQFLRGVPRVHDESVKLGWEAHGAYLVKGIEAPVDIFEIGVRDLAPFIKPAGGADTVRSVSAEEEATLGWRPAMSMDVPQRPGWVLESRLGEGGFGEVWLARNKQTREHRVFKFCFDVMRLRSFKRELALFRLIRERLGVRKDIACLHEVQLDAAPYFLESEYCGGGVLDDWVRNRTREGKPVPLEARLAVVSRVARALGAAHSLGIIHKDVKPSNIFMEVDADGVMQPKLADFGIGVVVDRTVFDGMDIGFSMGLTETDASRTGTRLYSAPEYMIGKPASVQGDIYSLGVLLYQMVVDDFERPLGVGWQRDVKDELLAEDIARCVDMETERRFGSAVELAERLETLEQRHAARDREVQAAKDLAWQQKRARVARMAALIALGVVGALSVILLQLNHSRQEAIKHATELEASQKKVLAQTELGRERLYVADMLAVTQESINRRAEGARELVNMQRPLAGQRDLRGWEWFFADAMLNAGDLSAAVSDRPLHALTVSPDGAEVAVGGESGEVSVWSTHSLTRLRAWQGATVAVRSLAWHADGLMAGLANGEIVRIDPIPMKATKRWLAHEGAVRVLHVSKAAEALLISGGEDGAMHWWQEDKAVRSCQWQGPVSGVDDQDDGTQVAVVLEKPTRLLLGRAEQLQDAKQSPLKRAASPIAWRPHSHLLALAVNDLPMAAWDPQLWADDFFVPNTHTAGMTSVAWAPDGSAAAVGGVDGKILLIDAQRVIEARLPAYGHHGPVTALHWLKGRERLLSIGADGTLRAWDELRRSAQASGFIAGGRTDDVQWHPQEDRVAVMLEGDEVRLLDGRTLQTLWQRPMPLPDPENAARRGGHLSFSPDGQWLAACCIGRGVVAWSLRDIQPIEITTTTQSVTSVEWTADSRALIFCDADGWHMHLANPANADQKLPSGQGEVMWAGGVSTDQIGVVINIDGQWHVQTFSQQTGSLLRDTMLPDGMGKPQCARSHFEKGLLAVGFDSGLLLWVEMSTGKVQRPPLSHVGPLLTLTWHPMGDRLLSAGADGSARIFNIDSVAQTWSMETKMPTDIVGSSWSADGSRIIVAAASNSYVRQYDATRSLQREKRLPEKQPHHAEDQLARALAMVERNPDEVVAWWELWHAVDAIRAKDKGPEGELLAAAAMLGIKALTAPEEKFAGEAKAALTSWHGHSLPLELQINQECILEQWLEVGSLTLKNTNKPWISLRRAQALEKLGRNAEAEQVASLAWKAYAGFLQIPPLLPESALNNALPRAVNLKPWSMISKRDEWIGGAGNTLEVVPNSIPQTGFSFESGHFIQLAGKNLRMSADRMLPRAAGWIPLGGEARHVSFLLGACNIREGGSLQDHVIGSLFLRRSSGGSVVIPLIYGKNVWDCWNPPAGMVARAPDDVIAWHGYSEYTIQKEHGLAFFRLDWRGARDADPVVAFSIISHMRVPAPMVMAVEVLPNP